MLRINITLTYGRKFVLPLLAQIIQKHPALSLDVRLSDAFIDLLKHRAIVFRLSGC